MPYIDAGGVSTYYEVDGAGEPLILLHGGTAPIETLAAQRAALSRRYRVWLPERRAQGRTGDVDGPITYELMAADTAAFMDAMAIGRAHFVGWSDGANVSMVLATMQPQRIRSLVLVGGNFHYSGLTAEFVETARVATPETWFPPLNAMNQALSPDGPAHFAVALEKLTTMWLAGPTLTPAELARVEVPALVLVGDNDVITLEHTVELYRSLPNAQLCVVPGASHGVLVEKPALANGIILDFLTSVGEGPTESAEVASP